MELVWSHKLGTEINSTKALYNDSFALSLKDL
jgi:hypothetical protein